MPLSPILRLQSDHVPQLEKLLVSNNLPSEDCAAQPGIFYGVFENDRLVAAGGLEAAQNFCLLRSLVVHPDYRGRGLARSLAEFLIREAEAAGRAAIYLLTETAAAYFENMGFSHVARDEVPGAVARTRQFSSLCPDSASCLRLNLPRPPAQV